MTLSPLDDLPVHQVGETMAHVGTTDRNFYDRYYFNLYGFDDDVFAIMGLGQYPNLGITDAFIAAAYDGRQHVVRASRPLGSDRLDLAVGPIRVEVQEGLRRVRVVCAPNRHGVELDVTWQATVPAFLEPRMVVRNSVGRETMNTMRFLQTGRWAGSLTVAGKTFDVLPQRWGGNRDRSWGVRPVGEPEPAGAASPGAGFFWNYAVAQFDDGSSIAYLAQEQPDGKRVLQEAIRLFPDEAGREPEPLGRPEHALEFAPGTRDVTRATVAFDGGLRMTAEVVTPIYLARGTGYGFEEDWRHGMSQGPDEVVQGRTYDLRDSGIQPLPGAIVDNLARFETSDGAAGHGLLEVMTIGPHHRYFTGWDDVAS